MIRNRISAFSVAILFACSVVAAQSSPQVKLQTSLDKGLEFLKGAQKPDGSWQGDQDPPGITAMVLKAVAGEPKYAASTDWVKKGYDRLLSFQLADGGIYKDSLANYNTAISVSALSSAREPSYKINIDRAVAYMKGLQWTEMVTSEDGVKINGQDDPWYGGWGYGGRSRGEGRPDLSNVQMALDALHDAGLKPDDPAYKAAIKFVSRLQNHSETNDQAWAGNDGGFVYGPSDNRQGESMAGEYTGPDGKRMLRSYGSMTYAGLKSLVYAGLTRDDSRVKAAWDWISKNWTLDENPGMKLSNPDAARQGLYYYYHTMARALNAYDEPIITDPQGKRHDWRVEMIDKLISLQKPDGSWIGDARWQESNPILTTAYVSIALREIQEDLKQHPATP